MMTKLPPLIFTFLCAALCISSIVKKIKPVAAIPTINEKNSGTLAGNIETLQNSHWYTSAADYIAKSEYFFKPAANKKGYCTPNRKNNLRFSYTEEGFAVSPRISDTMSKSTPPDTQQPQWSVKFNIDKAQVGAGKWEISGEKAAYITDKVTVQYINNEKGMRQNFVVKAPLENTAALQLHFSVTTKLKTVLQPQQLQFFHPHAGNVLNYNDLKVWDANGKILTAHFQKSKDNYCINVDTKNAVYPITVDPLSSSPSAALESNQAAAAFGCAVSSAGDVNGDGYSDVLVGAYLYDDGETDEGRVFVYHGSAAGLDTIPTITLESNQANSKFGYSVATAGDVNGDGYSDVIVGAYFYDSGETDEGAAFVFRGSATGININTSNILQSNQASAQFGISVACAGDVNGDGYSDVVVGANGYDNGQTNEGAAFIFHGRASGINTTAAATAESNKTNSFMGVSVSSAGDINGDGYSDVMAGAAAYSNGVGQTGEGAAFIYYGAATGVNITAPVTLESNQANAGMGQSVSAAGDVNGDGYSDIVIGAFNYDKGQTDEGAAFIYNGSAAGIVITATDTLESNQASAKAGRAVACGGDINGDGYSEVLVGAFLYDKGEIDEGAVFVYRGSATGINAARADTLQSNQADAQMGIAVASAGDLNGDGYSDIIAGAWNYDHGQTDEGYAFIYHGAAGNINKTAAYMFNGNQQAAGMGYSVASAGDVNGDGYMDVIVGSNLYDNVQSNEGAVFIYHGDSTGLNTTPALVIESNVSNAYFGCSVAAAGDVNGDGFGDIIVGAYNYTNGQTGEGAAFIYHGSGNGIIATAAIVLQSNIVSGNMGMSVSSAGDVNADGFSDVIVGVYGYTNGQTLEGAGFVYHGSATGISGTPSAILESNQAQSEMGYAVAAAGDVNGDGYGDIMVAARKYDNGQSNEGAVFIYHGSTSGISSIAATIEGNKVNGQIGNCVAPAGDVNGDGYSDVAVGAPSFVNAQTGQGVGLVYYGNASGINTGFADTLKSNSPVGQLGFSIASAGDVNGDGYSDIAIGAPRYVHNLAEDGAFFVFHGSQNGVAPEPADSFFLLSQNSYLGNAVASAGDINRDGFSDLIAGAYVYAAGPVSGGTALVYYGNEERGKRNNLRLYNEDLSTPLQQSNTENPFFGVGLYSKSLLGKQKGKLVWETKRNGVPFSGIPITNSTASTSEQTSYTDLGINGKEIKQQATKLFPTKDTYVRVRIKYNPATAITGQLYGAWHYPDYFTSGWRNFNLSVTSYVWTGVVSTAWENPANWSSFAVPGITSDVLIPALRPRYPLVSINTAIKNLTVTLGAGVTVATGVNLTIVGH